MAQQSQGGTGGPCFPLFPEISAKQNGQLDFSQTKHRQRIQSQFATRIRKSKHVANVTRNPGLISCRTLSVAIVENVTKFARLLKVLNAQTEI